MSWSEAPQGGQRPAQMVLETPPALPRARHAPACVHSNWVLELGFRGQTAGEDSAWPRGDSLKGLERGPGRNWQCTQDGAQVRHRHSTLDVGEEGRAPGKQPHC